MQKNFKDLNSTMNDVLNANKFALSQNDKLFLQRIYGNGLDKYSKRLKALGFVGQDRVLDAGCGYGQWSLALSELNRIVCACDNSVGRIDFLNELTRELEVDNIESKNSGIESLPYEDNSFDAIISYSVIQLTRWEKTLAEFIRVLKPGGRVYISTNGLGWYLHLWMQEPNAADDYDPKQVAKQSFSDTLLYQRVGKLNPGASLIMEPDEVRKEMIKIGFKDIKIGPEGTVSYSQEGLQITKPFLLGNFKSVDAVFDILAQKN